MRQKQKVTRLTINQEGTVHTTITQLALAARQEEQVKCSKRLETLAANKKQREEELMRVQQGLETCPGTTDFQRKWLIRQQTRATVLQGEVDFYNRRITREEKEMAEHTMAVAGYEYKLKPVMVNVPSRTIKTSTIVGVEQTAKRKRTCRGKKYKNKPREPRRPKAVEKKPNKTKGQKPKRGQKQDQGRKAA